MTSCAIGDSSQQSSTGKVETLGSWSLLNHLFSEAGRDSSSTDVPMPICTLNAGRQTIPRAPLHHVACKLQGPKSRSIELWCHGIVGRANHARDSAAMHHPSPAASAPALR